MRPRRQRPVERLQVKETSGEAAIGRIRKDSSLSPPEGVTPADILPPEL